MAGRLTLSTRSTSGRRLRLGTVALSGDPGLSVEEFRKRGKLDSINKTLFFFKSPNKVTHDTTGSGLTRTAAVLSKERAT